MVKVKSSGEIDLVELFLKGINIIRANFWLIVLFFCLGTALGVGYYYSSNKVYESTMVISSGILTRSYSENLVERLTTHRREGNYAAVMSLLGVSETTAKSIADIDIKNISAADNVKDPDKFIITAYVLDQEVLPELQKGLIHYIENNEYVKIRVEQNRNYLKQTLAKIEQEIKDMEEFKQKIVSGAFFQAAKGNVMFDPTSVNSKILELTKEKLNLQNSLALSNSVQVIEGFSKFQRPSSPKLSLSIIAGSFVGLFFVGALIAFKSVRRLVKMADAARQRT
ncbi:MAG TPA: Wzz/FepE/Etk N-terminal domain-containing protein [Chryseolinea sp.]|nr:Wzz/FepE/Etk N-terminal domain-containing protein [Chryseolinea sp.]